MGELRVILRERTPYKLLQRSPFRFVESFDIDSQRRLPYSAVQQPWKLKRVEERERRQGGYALTGMTARDNGKFKDEILKEWNRVES